MRSGPTIARLFCGTFGVPRSDADRLADLLEAVARIRQYTSGMTEGDFRSDQKTVDAVLHNLVIIGEAARGLEDATMQATPKIPWVDIAGMRNIVVHQYFGVDLSIVWTSATRDAPELADAIRAAIDGGRLPAVD